MDYDLELVFDKKGNIRQAGTVDGFNELIAKLRLKAENDLYFFCKFILGRDYLTPALHGPVCDWLMQTPPVRKMLLLPRRHAKTSIVSHGLPLHILIQKADNNHYWPGIAGCDMKILMAGEVAKRAEENMSVIRNVFEQNVKFRALWPHLCWTNPRAQASAWNNTSLVIPRNVHFPDPTIRAVGAGGAITGTRPHVAIKDDIVSEEAANSPQVMQNAIDWHRNTRALYESQDRSLEYIIGTRWAVLDLYSHIIQNDPTVETMVRSIVEDGRPIYPEVFSLEDVELLRQQMGVMFALMYMNNVGDPDLVDFPEEELRFFKRYGNVLEFDGDLRDSTLEKKMTEVIHDNKRGMLLSDAVAEYIGGRDMFFRYNRRKDREF